MSKEHIDYESFKDFLDAILRIDFRKNHNGLIKVTSNNTSEYINCTYLYKQLDAYELELCFEGKTLNIEFPEKELGQIQSNLNILSSFLEQYFLIKPKSKFYQSREKEISKCLSALNNLYDQKYYLPILTVNVHLVNNSHTTLRYDTYDHIFTYSYGTRKYLGRYGVREYTGKIFEEHVAHFLFIDYLYNYHLLAR